MRVTCVLVAALLLVGGSPALGQQLMLEEEPPTEFTGTGWTFLVLTLATLSYGLKVRADSKDDLSRADTTFAQYLAAGTPAQATTLRAATDDALNDARANEKRANVAFALTILFGLTAYFSFLPDHMPDASLVVTPQGMLYTYRF